MITALSTEGCAATASRSNAANAPSATTTTGRPGSQGSRSTSSWRAPSSTLLCRGPRVWWYRSAGASTVRKGNAHIRSAQGMGPKSSKQTQRSPLALTLWLLEERTGSC